MATHTRPRSIKIDGGYADDRYLVKIDDLDVWLTGKSFTYLCKLAWSRLNSKAGWIYKEDIEPGFNQARYLYRLKKEIHAAIPSLWPVIENNRSGYYRLDLTPDRISTNIDNLTRHSDCEIRGMFAGEIESTMRTLAEQTAAEVDSALEAERR